MSQLENIINEAFEQRLDITPANVSAEIRNAVTETLNLLDKGALRVAEKIDGDWVTHQWLKTPISDTDFAQQLFAQENVTVLPGSFLSREFGGINPGVNHVRIALVAPLDDCIDAAHRIKHFLNTL